MNSSERTLLAEQARPAQSDPSPPAVRSRVRIQSEPDALGRTGGYRPKVAVESVFEVNDVSVFYGAKKALAGVSMRIPRSRITALIGPSGCGKSTFIRCLN